MEFRLISVLLIVAIDRSNCMLNQDARRQMETGLEMQIFELTNLRSLNGFGNFTQLTPEQRSALCSLVYRRVIPTSPRIAEIVVEENGFHNLTFLFRYYPRRRIRVQNIIGCKIPMMLIFFWLIPDRTGCFFYCVDRSFSDRPTERTKIRVIHKYCLNRTELIQMLPPAQGPDIIDVSFRAPSSASTEITEIREDE